MIEINIDNYCYDTSGMIINKYCKRMIDLAKEKDAKIFGDFNNVRLEATKETVLENLVSFYFKRLEEDHKKYLQSDEYKEKQNKDTIQVQQYNDQLKKCIDILPYLKTNKEILIEIDKIIDATDFIGVENCYIFKIAQILEDKGFKENDFVRDTSIYTNSDHHAKYIIGQVLSTIYNVGAIHGMIHSFIKLWMGRFGDKNE